MPLEHLIDTFGDDMVLLMAGLSVGLVFGVAAQRSAFCLRASTVEVSQGVLGPRMSVWLVAFFAALATTQGAILFGALDVSQARPLSGVGSLSGAIIGGMLFGIGMVLARGCASRLLVLSATGNLRALITGLVLTVVAQSSLRGILAPSREYLSQLWVISGDGRDLGYVLSLSTAVVTWGAVAALVVSIGLARYRKLAWTKIFAAACVGGAVTLGWWATYALSQVSFEVVDVSSVTFTGPATDTLMAFVAERSVPLSFGLGLVPGVFLGAGGAAILFREWHIERFSSDTPMERYLVGAVLMGFGAMLAGGCAVGAAMSGGAIMAVTAWVAALSIWGGGVATSLVLTYLETVRRPSVA
ncbi:lipocalin [Jannaschia sp. EhC01]|nr:lipocalin [Jannaschia sp. EhC01]